MRKTIGGWLAIGAVVGCMGASTALALPIIYNVNLTNGAATLTGSITTDGALGFLTAANITSRSFSGYGSAVFHISSTTSGAHVDVLGAPFLSASGSALSLLPLVGGGNNGNVAFFGSAGNANEEVLFASSGNGPNYVISNPNPTVGTSLNTEYFINRSGSSSPVATAVRRVPEPATLSLLALVYAGGAFAGNACERVGRLPNSGTLRTGREPTFASPLPLPPFTVHRGEVEKRAR